MSLQNDPNYKDDDKLGKIPVLFSDKYGTWHDI